MTLQNLELALQLNNNNINREINLIISYINQFATNQKILHENIDLKFTELESDISLAESNLSYQISSVDTRLTNVIQNLSDDYGNHKTDTDIHITSAERDKWNNVAQYTDGTVKDHAENLVIHVTQEDKDLWNATLDNAKSFAQELFNRLTSFEIIKCTQLPTENIKTMTIYFLQIDPEQDDLYEEYMYIDGKWEKIGNTRIDLSDYVTKSMLQSSIDTINNTINTKETAINRSIADLETKHDQDIQNLQDNISDLSDTVTQFDTDINQTIDTKTQELQNNINNLETKHDQDVQDLQDNITDLSYAFTQLDTDINQTITNKAQELQGNINTLENKHDQDVQDINDELNQLEQDIDDINTGISNLHTHDNKSVLDNLTQQVIDNSHTHINKSALDNLTQQVIDDSHSHTNKSALDNLTQTVIDDSHKHNNKDILDKFSTDNNGNLLYNNSEIGETFTEEDVTNLINYLWHLNNNSNFITADDKDIITKDNKIFIAKRGDS